MTARVVLDASALLALLHEEPGADQVEQMLEDSLMSCVNLSEVLQKAEQHDVDTEGLEYDLEALGVDLVPFDERTARVAASLWEVASHLSLGDRACLAVASMFEGQAVTAESGWTKGNHGVLVTLIR